MPTKHLRLRPLYAAAVRTTDEVVVATVAGNIKQQAIVHVTAGGELPDNLASGEYERLEKLGAFKPLPSRAERGLVEVTPQNVLSNTAPPGQAVATPSDIRIPTEEEAAAQERLVKAQEDVRRAFDESQNDPDDVDAVLAGGLSPAELARVDPSAPGAAGNPVPTVPVEGDAVAPPADEPNVTQTPRQKTAAKKTASRTTKATKKAASARKRS